MQIRVTTIEPLPAGHLHVAFTARFGSGHGIWRGAAPHLGEDYQIELTLLDELELGRNAAVSVDELFLLVATPETVALNVLVESVDPDCIAGLRLGSDCLFMVEITRGKLELKPGQWVRACVPFERLELWPYDVGAFTVVER